MNNIIFKFSYGLFVVSAREDEKDGGCIINTAIQVTENPFQVAITINKANHTHDMIMRTNKCNLSFLSEKCSFDVFKRFGFQSGRDVDKFEGYEGAARAANGIMYLNDENVNGMMSVKVTQTIDLGTHTMFIGEVSASEVLDDANSCTYTYYQSNIKPKPQAAANVEKKAWVCTICGYVYEGDELPEGYICPLCKHGVDAFEPLKK